MKKIPLGLIAVSVIMLFTAVATDIFWLAKLAGRPFQETMPVSSKVYDAFFLPDMLMSLFLYIGSIGLLKLRRWGWMFSLVAMGMWLFDSLLVLGITRLSRLSILGPSLLFAFFSIVYLLIKKDLFD